MNQSELQNKLDELTRDINELCEMLELTTNATENTDNEDDNEDEDWNEEDEDIDGACGVGIGFDISQLLDPRYNKHILSEPDDDGMVEISDELYDRLYGKYHSKEDMLDDIVRELDFYISGKYVGDKKYWAETRYLGIDKESNRPRIGTMDELNEEDSEFDIYDIKEFEQCYSTNANDMYAEVFKYKLVNDKAIRNLIDKYYPELPW